MLGGMNEPDREPSRPGDTPFDDDTRPIGAHQHRYGERAEDTTAFGPAASGHGAGPGGYRSGYGAGAPAGGASYPGGGPRQESGRHERGGRRRGLGVGVLVGALVLGGLAGFGGAAGYDALTPDEATTSTSDEPTASTVVQREDTPAAEGSVEDVANSVLPSVVKINVRGPQGEGSGSGVIISGDGEILTNYHVVEVAEQGGAVSVGFNDGSTAQASVVGTDPLTDLAIIKVSGVNGLTPAALGQSGNLDVGEEVVAIGSPFGLDATVTSGIVSALQRPVSVSGQGSAMNTAYPAIQTDAAINPGNSGGPLVNMDGEVVGINSSIRTSSVTGGQGGSIGLGFAIPLDEVLPIVDQLRNGEDPTHARLGVEVTDAASDDGLLQGAGVAAIEPGSAADRAGLERGDVVIRVGDQPVSDATSLVATVRGHRPGDQVTLTVVRDGQEMQVEATLDSDGGTPAS